MPLDGLLLVLASALLHAYWNFLAKGAGQPEAFVVLLLGAAGLLFGPLAVAGVVGKGVPGLGWACALASGLLYALYFFALARAYRQRELSIAYPLARGVGPLLTLVGAMLFLGERPSGMGMLGVGTIVVGVWALHLPPKARGGWRESWRGLREPGSLWALLAGSLTPLYSLVDGYGVRIVPPPVYVSLAYAVAALAMWASVPLWLSPEALGKEWRHRGRRAVWTGFLSPATYLLVLFAMRVAPVGYVVALRSSSVLFSVLWGVKGLGEESRASRWSGAICITLGMALIALWG